MHKPCSSTIAAIRLRGARAIAVALLLAGAVTALTYGLLAPVAAPQLAHLVFDRLAPRGGEWTADAEAIRFEPFTLAFELHNVDVSNAAGDFHAEASLCRVDFSVTSLMLARPILNSLDIRGGALRVAARAEPAIWSQLRALSTDMRIATLDAELAEIALETPDGDKAIHQVALRGTRIDFAAAHGSVAVVGGNAGGGTSIDAELVADPIDAGARLLGTATVAGGRIPIGAWAIGVPKAVIAVDATLSVGGLEASFTLRDGNLAGIDNEASWLASERADAGVSWRPTSGVRAAHASASLLSGGRAEVELAYTNNATRLHARLIEVPAVALAWYVTRALGATPAGGVIDVELSSGAQRPTAEHLARVRARGLRLTAAEPGARRAVALLEQPGGDIAIDLALAQNLDVAGQIVEQVSARAGAIAAAPFETLGALVGREAVEMSAIEFTPGSSEPTAQGRSSLAAIAAALRLRPRVGVQIEPSQDAVSDREALARTQVALHVTLATARADPDSAARGRGSADVDFASARVQDVLDEFAGERLGAATLDRIGASFAHADEPPSAPERVAYYRALFDALVESERINDTALHRLARFRVNTVEAQLAAEGIGDSRVLDGHEAVSVDDRALVFLPLAVRPALDYSGTSAP